MVVAVVILVEGNVTHMNFFGLEGGKYPISSFLDLLFFWDLLGYSLLLFAGAVFLVHWVSAQTTGEKGLFSSLCSSMNTSVFLLSEGKGFIWLLQELQVVD